MMLRRQKISCGNVSIKLCDRTECTRISKNDPNTWSDVTLKRRILPDECSQSDRTFQICRRLAARFIITSRLFRSSLPTKAFCSSKMNVYSKNANWTGGNESSKQRCARYEWLAPECYIIEYLYYVFISSQQRTTTMPFHLEWNAGLCSHRHLLRFCICDFNRRTVVLLRMQLLWCFKLFLNWEDFFQLELFVCWIVFSIQPCEGAMATGEIDLKLFGFLPSKFFGLFSLKSTTFNRIQAFCTFWVFAFQQEK